MGTVSAPQGHSIIRGIHFEDAKKLNSFTTGHDNRVSLSVYLKNVPTVQRKRLSPEYFVLLKDLKEQRIKKTCFPFSCRAYHPSRLFWCLFWISTFHRDLYNIPL